MICADHGISDHILEQASDWLFRLRDCPSDARLRRELDAWIAADPSHERAWRIAHRAWAATGAVTPAFVAPLQSAAAKIVPIPLTRKPRRVRRAAMAMAAGLAALTLLPAVELRLRADHLTGTGETQAVTLADGSQITLDADSAINSTMTADRRTVSLLRGEAFFQVTADKSRPFVVHGPDVTITVTGTAFDVLFTEKTSSVAVAGGSVTVAHAGAEAQLTPGQRLVIDRASGASQIRAVDPADVGAWREGRMVVGDMPLSSAVESIRRHYFGFVVLNDAALADARVTGVYDLSDPERALRALVGPYGGTVRRMTPYLLVVSPS